MSVRSQRGRDGSSEDLLTIDDFTICGHLGEGEFGRVMMARKNATQEIFAVKVLRKTKLLQRGGKTVTRAIWEKQVLQDLSEHRHPFIVSLHHSFQDEAHLYLVMDFVGGGDLFALIEARRDHRGCRLPEEWARVYSAEIALALEHVHSHGIIFRDLKPENVMVGADGHLKLTDFGFAKKMIDEHGRPMRTTRGSTVGTPEYMAPELIKGASYSFPLDWWTLGCLTYEMLVGRAPFSNDDMQELIRMIANEEPVVPGHVSQEANDWIRALMHKDPADRLGPPGALSLQADGSRATLLPREHPWQKGHVDWEALMRGEVVAPFLPFQPETGADISSPRRGPAQEQADRLQEAFGESWTAPSSESPRGTARRRSSSSEEEEEEEAALAEGSTSAQSNPMLHGKSTNTSLALELNAEGSIWRVSNPLSELLGQPRGQRHRLFGLPLLDGNTDTLPAVEPATLPPFAKAFRRMLTKLQDQKESEVAPPTPPRSPSCPDRNGDGPRRSRSKRALETFSPQKAALAEQSGARTRAETRIERQLTLDTFSPAVTPTFNRGQRIRRPTKERWGEQRERESRYSGTEGGEEGDVVQVRVKGRESPLHLRYVFEYTMQLTGHSVALMPTQQGHAAITVIFTDVTRSEEAKDLVRKRYDWSYNAKLPDDKVASLFHPRVFSFNAKGTQAPVRDEGDAASRTDIERYLDRRNMFKLAFPDLQFEILEINAIGERVVTSWHWHATHLGPYPVRTGGVLRDLPPTGQRVLVHGIAVDVCRGGKIVDHAAYYDEAAIVRQLQPAGDEDLAVDATPSTLDAITKDEDPKEVAAQAQMQRFYANKMLANLAAVCTGVGFGVCRAEPELPIAACSPAFADVLGLDAATKKQALGRGLLTQLRDQSEAAEPASDAARVLSALEAAIGAQRAATELLQLHDVSGGPPTLLLVAIAPLLHGGNLFAVILIDLTENIGERTAAASEPPPTAFATHFAADESLGTADGATADGALEQPAASPRSRAAPLGQAAHAAHAQQQLEELLVAALHAFSDVGFCVADQHMADLPLVWLSHGSQKMSGYTREQLIGHNCRKLQGDATDPAAVAAIKEAIAAERAVRVTLWNVARGGKGFWNCLSLFPSFDELGQLRYYVAVQIRLPPELHRRLIAAQRKLGAVSSANFSCLASPRGGGAVGRAPTDMPQLRTPSTNSHPSRRPSAESAPRPLDHVKPPKGSSACTIL